MERRFKAAALAAIAVVYIAAPTAFGNGGADRPATAVAPGSTADGPDGASSLTSGWKIQSSAVATGSGAVISDPAYRPAGWLPISRPETLMAGLVENGRYPDVFHSNRLASVPTDQFRVNWWYRTQVTVHPRAGQHAFLVMNGVLSRANLWVNGAKVADQSELQGAYSRFEYDITSRVRDGANAVALDVYHNKPGDSGYLTLNMVDWNPGAPDDNTGLQFAPQLRVDGPVSVRDAHVSQSDAADLSTSDLTVKAALRNNTATPQNTRFTATVSGPGTEFEVTRTVTVPPNATVPVSLSPADDRRLHLDHPAVWWPYQMGGQPMYRLRAVSTVDGAPDGGVSDRSTVDFGIRTVTSSLTPVVPGQTLGPDGYRQFTVNGRPLVVRGGGWSPDLFLRYSHDNVRDQLRYLKNMGLNAIRFEGNFPPEDMFAQMDREGILAMPGWECCVKWEQPSEKWSPGVKANAANQAGAVARWLRDHPSVFAFFHGSDNEPDADKETIYLDAFTAADWQTPQVASAEYKSSPKLGQAGTKEGPYNYVPPGYWWHVGPELANEDDAFTNSGTAYGFDTETSAGNTIPTRDSLDRFLSPAEQAQIWDPASTKGLNTGPEIYHTSPFSGYTSVSRLGQYNTALWHRYGPWTDMDSYQDSAQAGGYEVTRAQFEAYIGRSRDPANPSTGVIYWQLNKAWPALQWQLYGYDFDQSGVYFGAKKANEPVHVMYSYSDGTVLVANLTGQRQSGLHATAEVIDLDGTVKDRRETDVAALGSQDVRTVLFPSVPDGISTTYFLKLTLTRDGRAVSRNVYWLSTTPDRLDWEQTVGKGFGAVYEPEGYADLTGLRSLPAASLRVSATTHRDGGDDVTDVTVTNVSDHPTPSLLTRADIRRAAPNGAPAGGDDQVRPILWTDNDVTLWPGETVTLTAVYRHGLLGGAPATVTVSGWNVPVAAVRLS